MDESAKSAEASIMMKVRTATIIALIGSIIALSVQVATLIRWLLLVKEENWDLDGFGVATHSLMILVFVSFIIFFAVLLRNQTKGVRNE